MKKSLRCVALVGVLALTAWVGTTSRVNAADPYWCGTLDGSPCQPAGSRATCNAPGGTGSCLCKSTLTWRCIY